MFVLHRMKYVIIIKNNINVYQNQKQILMLYQTVIYLVLVKKVA